MFHEFHDVNMLSILNQIITDLNLEYDIEQCHLLPVCQIPDAIKETITRRIRSIRDEAIEFRKWNKGVL